MFCLCRMCVLTYHTGECCLTANDERAQTGTCVMDEVRPGVDKGYSIFQIYEVYENKFTRSQPKSREDGLFAEYIDMC